MDILTAIQREADHKVVDFTSNGRCSNCGACCSGYLPLSAQEIRRIHEYVNQHGIQEQHNGVAVMVGPMLDMTCPFRDNIHKRCLIYSVRPEICRAFQCNQPIQVIEERKRRFMEMNRYTMMRLEFFPGSLDRMRRQFLCEK